MPTSVNIICLDVPFPANYGGAINMFHKIRWLHKQGVEIYLHCFEYGSRLRTEELNKYCKEVYYYPRKTSLSSFFSLLPYNVKSRISEDLKQNLLKNDYPIIFEALHTCYLLNDPDLANRKKIFRESNIEHDYFYHLAKNERHFLKKLYLYTEAFKLKRYEKIVTSADLMLVVSTEDALHFKKHYDADKVSYLPSFHANDTVKVKPGNSNYILYHGNLSVSENNMAAAWLIDNVFSQLSYEVIIAGLNPPKFLKDKITKFSHITLKKNCTDEEMKRLVENAQIHCLYTPQATGLKLKLLNVLYKGRFVIANQHMVHGTDVSTTCIIANTPAQYIDAIKKHMSISFTNEDLLLRESILKTYDNVRNSEELIKFIQS